MEHTPVPLFTLNFPLSTLLYPCTCLCLGFSQITRTFPWRRITLHRSHIFFTDACTFIIHSFRSDPVS